MAVHNYLITEVASTITKPVMIQPTTIVCLTSSIKQLSHKALNDTQLTPKL